MEREMLFTSLMARCYRCGIQTDLYCNGSPVCNSCCKPKPKEKSKHLTTAELNARVTDARSAYRRALVAQGEALRFKHSLAPNNPDGSMAIHRANQEVELTAMEFRKALRDFVTAWDQDAET